MIVTQSGDKEVKELPVCDGAASEENSESQEKQYSTFYINFSCRKSLTNDSCQIENLKPMDPANWPLEGIVIVIVGAHVKILLGCFNNITSKLNIININQIFTKYVKEQ